MKTNLIFKFIDKAIILTFSIIIMTSCSDKENYIGKWEDNIKLSTRNVEFLSETDSVIITTQGDWWWINGVTFEDSIYGYSHSEEIDIASQLFSIEEENFIVERRDKNTLFVRIEKNKTGDVRIMNISFQAGDYFDNVAIKQAAN